MISLILLIAVVLVAALSRRLHRTILAPWSVHLVLWFGLFFLYSLGWITYTPLETGTWLLLVGSLVTYSLGAMNAILMSHVAQKPTALPPASRWFEGVHLGRYGKFHALLALLGALGALGYFLVIEQVYGLSTLLSDPGLIRSTQDSPEYVQAFFWWKFLFYLNWLVIPLAVARIVYQRRETPKWVYLTLVLPVLASVAQVSRAQILLIAVVVLVIVLAGSQRQLQRREIFLFGVVLVIPAVYFVLAGEVLGKTYEYSISLTGGFYGPDVLRPAAGLYNYIVGNLPAFQAYVSENAGNHTRGLFQLLPLFKVLNSTGILNVSLPLEVGDFLYIPFPFNTYTYLNVFFKDWGVAGIVLGPLVFGFLSSWFYLHACYSGKVWLIIASAFLVHASLVSMGTNVLVSTPQWEWAVLLAVLAAYSRTRDVRKPRPIESRRRQAGG